LNEKIFILECAICLVLIGHDIFRCIVKPYVHNPYVNRKTLILAGTIFDIHLIADLCCRCPRISYVSHRWIATSEAIVVESVAQIAWLPADKYFRSVSCLDAEILQWNVWEVALFDCVVTDVCNL